MERKQKAPEKAPAVELELSAEPAAVPSAETAPAAPKRKRGRPRKNPMPQPAAGLSSMGLSLPATGDSPQPVPQSPLPPQLSSTASEPVVPAAPPVPQAPLHPLDTVAPEAISSDVTLASVSIEKTMDSMVRQWSSVKDISNTITVNLEKVTKLLTEQTQDLEALKAPVAKASPVSRWAIAVSVCAGVLSLVSLSLSQSAREAVITQHVPVALTTKAPPALALSSLSAAVKSPIVPKAAPVPVAPLVAAAPHVPRISHESSTIESELAKAARATKERISARSAKRPAAVRETGARLAKHTDPHAARATLVSHPRAGVELAYRRAGAPRLKPRFVKPVPPAAVDPN